MDPIHTGTARIPCPACGVLLPLEVFAVPSGATAGELTLDLSTDLGPARAHAESCTAAAEPLGESATDPVVDAGGLDPSIGAQGTEPSAAG